MFGKKSVSYRNYYFSPELLLYTEWEGRNGGREEGRDGGRKGRREEKKEKRKKERKRLGRIESELSI